MSGEGHLEAAPEDVVHDGSAEGQARFQTCLSLAPDPASLWPHERPVRGQRGQVPRLPHWLLPGPAANSSNKFLYRLVLSVFFSKKNLVIISENELP